MKTLLLFLSVLGSLSSAFGATLLGVAGLPLLSGTNAPSQTNALPPVISPAGGLLAGGSTNVTIASAGNMVYWTTNGDAPTTNLTGYASGYEVTISTTNFPLQAIAWTNDGYRLPSTVASATYTNAPAPGSWVPSDSTNLQVWLRTDDLTALSTEGGSVSNWPNAVAAHATWYATNQTSAHWPTLTNSFAGIAGISALVFDGTDDRLWLSNAVNITRNVDSCTIVAVVRVNNGAVTQSILAINRESNGQIREALQFNSSERPQSSMRSVQESASTVALGHSASLTAPVYLHADYIHTNRTDVTGAVQLIYTNGILATNFASVALPTNTVDTASISVCLGDSTTTATTPYTGEIAELLVFVPAADESTRTNLYAYLKAKIEGEN